MLPCFLCKCLLWSTCERCSRGGQQRTFRIKHGINDLVSCWIGIWRLTDTWMTPQNHYGGMLWFFCLFYYVWRRGHHLLQLYWTWLQHCLPLKLQNVDSNTSPPPPPPPQSAWWGGDECIFWVNYPFKLGPWTAPHWRGRVDKWRRDVFPRNLWEKHVIASKQTTSLLSAALA